MPFRPANMKTVFPCLASLLFSAALYAGSDSPLVLANFRGPESPVSISAHAQYLTAEIRIECDEDDWSTKLTAIEETRHLLALSAEKEGFKLRIEQTVIFQNSYRKFSFSSSGGSSDAVSDLLIMAPLDEQTNMTQVVRRFHAVVSGLKTAKKIRVSLGSISLALENPESFRTELLTKIRQHVETSANLLLDSPGFLISGLDEPVRVRQTSEREVEVFLPFRVTYTQKR